MRLKLQVRRTETGSWKSRIVQLQSVDDATLGAPIHRHWVPIWESKPMMQRNNAITFGNAQLAHLEGATDWEDVPT